MKTSPLLAGVAGLTLIALTATTIYAQTATGTSLVDKMKAAARNSFTLSADLNPGQTGFESAPIVGKKTGNMLTAGEWNRMLEIISQGNISGGSSGYSGELWKCTCGGYINMVTTQNLTFGETCVFGNGGTASNVQYSSWSCTKISNIGSGTGSSSSNNLVYINPDNTDFAPLECTPGVNYMINPIAFSAGSASSFTTRKVAVLGAGNWQVKGTGFVRIRNKSPDASQALRVSSVIDGVTTHLLDNSVDAGMYANSFLDPVSVPAGKTAELRTSVKNNTLYGGNIVAWCN